MLKVSVYEGICGMVDCKQCRSSALYRCLGLEYDILKGGLGSRHVQYVWREIRIHRLGRLGLRQNREILMKDSSTNKRAAKHSNIAGNSPVHLHSSSV